MAESKTPRGMPNDQGEPEFVVTVQQEIGRVRYSSTGSEPMLRACFGLIADAVAERADGNPQQEFAFRIDVGSDADPILVAVTA